MIEGQSFKQERGRGGGGEGGGTGIPPRNLKLLLCYNYLNIYNRVYNTIAKYTIIIGLM